MMMNTNMTDIMLSSQVKVMAVAAMMIFGHVAKAQPGGAKPSTMDALMKTHGPAYVATTTPSLVDAGSSKFLTIDGQGEPGGQVFAKHVGRIYQITYMMMTHQMKQGREFQISMLEGLWWGSQDKLDFFDEPRSTWNWKLLIRVPDNIKKKDLKDVIRSTGGDPATSHVKLETIKEGKCVQALHVGPYATEPETIAKMHAFATSKNLKQHGVHHEIYIDNPNSTPPEKLRTILRLPVK